MTPAVAKAIWLICVGIWCAIRYPHQRRSRKVPVTRKATGLRETLLLTSSTVGLGLVPLAYIAFGVPRFADYPFSPAMMVAGALVFAAALALFYRTHRELGRNWSQTLEVRATHTLVTEGLYRYVRHPMYSAFWLWAIAQALLLPNWVAGLSGIVGWGILFFCRVGREERLMLDVFGDAYRAYMERTARVVPWIY